MSAAVEELPEWHAYPVVEFRLTRLTQSIPAHKPGEGAIGDCYRTAIACLVGSAKPETVPHFPEATMSIERAPGWHSFALARRWLRSRGRDLLEMDIGQAEQMDVPYLATVNSKTGDWGHCVIAHGSEIIHDPSGLGSYTMADLRHDRAEVLCFPYEPDPEEMLRRWAVLQVEEDFQTALSGLPDRVGSR